jgi:hypothetical protein
MAARRRRWLTSADDHERRRRAELTGFVLDSARADFDQRYATSRFGPVVAVVTADEDEANLGEVLKAMPTLLGDLEVSTLVVVDGGGDTTAGVAIDAGAFTCVLPVNLGQGAALRLGYRLAAERGARYVVTLDADGQSDPEGMAALLAPLLDDTADFVIASRHPGIDRDTDRLRRAGTELNARVVNAIVSQRLTDPSGGYRAFRIELLDDIAPHLVQDRYQTPEVVITAASRGWRITEQPTVWHPGAPGGATGDRSPVFDPHYARVIATTWFRVTLGNRHRL